MALAMFFHLSKSSAMFRPLREKRLSFLLTLVNVPTPVNNAVLRRIGSWWPSQCVITKTWPYTLCCRMVSLLAALRRVFMIQADLLLLFVSVSCGTVRNIGQDICNCLSALPGAADYRHQAKHVPLPTGTFQEISVATILSWPQDSVPLPFDQPRTGRELQLVHFADPRQERSARGHRNPVDSE